MSTWFAAGPWPPGMMVELSAGSGAVKRPEPQVKVSLPEAKQPRP